MIFKCVRDLMVTVCSSQHATRMSGARYEVAHVGVFTCFTSYLARNDVERQVLGWVGPRGTGANENLGICRNFSQTRRRARPSVGRGGADRADRVRDLELRERQVSKQTACQSVLPLALRTGRTVDADGERRSSNWKVDGDQLFTDGDDGAASAYCRVPRKSVSRCRL